MSEGILGHEVAGEGGETVALLNGGMMTWASWKPVARALEDGYRLLLSDFRGQFLSPGPSHDTLEAHADDLERLLDHLEIGRVHLLGASFGAQVALGLAARRPERVASLIAVTATDRPTAALRAGSIDLRRVIRDVAAGGDKGALHDLLVEQVFSADWAETHRAELAARRGQIGALPQSWFDGLVGILDAADAMDLEPILGRVVCPALVVVAEHDRVLPPARGRALAERLGSELAVHPTSGHALVAEDPEWLGRTCREFLDRVTGAAPRASGGSEASEENET